MGQGNLNTVTTAFRMYLVNALCSDIVEKTLWCSASSVSLQGSQPLPQGQKKILSLSFLLFSLLIEFIGVTVVTNYVGFKYTTLQYIICTLPCMLTIRSPVSFR